MHAEGKLDICNNGLHVCDDAGDLLFWLSAEIWIVEWKGESVRSDKDHKRVVRSARLLRKVAAWDDRSARLFAADCAERVLPIFEGEYPDDDRPRKAIEAARAFANGNITESELAAAGDAAEDAAWAAGDAAEDAAGDAARDAAGDAAWDAARDAAGAAGAAWAARAAAGAAEDAARDAAWDAAWDAEHEWQVQRLIDVIGELK